MPLKRYLAEFIAAFFLVFAGVGAIVSNQYRLEVQVQDGVGLLGIALAHGLALALAIAAIGRISGGHANPAVSLAFLVARRISFKDFAGYVAAQLLGGVAAAFLLKRLLPSGSVSFVGTGVPALAEKVQPFQGAAIEVILTFFLVFVIWGVAVDKRGPKNLAPFAIGLAVSFDILAGGTFTGAAMNPARWFGPALAGAEGFGGKALAEAFKNWPVWTAGPILGALLASLLYETFFLADDEVEEAEAELAAIESEQDDEMDESEEWRGTPSPMVPPSAEPKPAGEPSTMVPPAPASTMTEMEPDQTEAAGDRDQGPERPGGPSF